MSNPPEDDAFCSGCILGAGFMFFILIFGLMIPFTTMDNVWHNAVIKHGAAHYDAKTGNFTWNDESGASPTAGQAEQAGKP